MQKILIAEDEIVLGNALKDRLGKTYQILIARNGEEALSMIGKEKPNLVLLDIMMPVTNGLDVLKALKNNVGALETPVIMFTNLYDENTKKATMDLGAVEYLVKADTPLQKLEEIIKKYLVK